MAELQSIIYNCYQCHFCQSYYPIDECTKCVICDCIICNKKSCYILIDDQSFCHNCLVKTIKKRPLIVSQSTEQRSLKRSKIEQNNYLIFDNHIRSDFEIIINYLCFVDDYKTILLIGRLCKELNKLTNKEEVWKRICTNLNYSFLILTYNIIGLNTYKELCRFYSSEVCVHKGLPKTKLQLMFKQFSSKCGVKKNRDKLLELVPYKQITKKVRDNSSFSSWSQIHHTTPKYTYQHTYLYPDCHIKWVISHIINPTLDNYVKEADKRGIQNYSCSLFVNSNETSNMVKPIG